MSETLHPEERVTSFLLIRHGHTEATENGRLYTDPNAPLTERGRRQAQSLKVWLEQERVDILLSSPSLRVRATADLISVAHNLAPIIVDGLNEWHVGDWEGRTYLDIKRSEPDLYEAWSKDPIHNAPPGGESITDLCQRAQRHICTLISTYEGKHIALVTHAGIIRGILVYALGIPFENFWRLSIPTGSVCKIDFSANFATVHFTAFKPPKLE